jgi:hypothetical protein
VSGLVGRCDESGKRTTLVNDVDLRSWRARAYARADVSRAARALHDWISYRSAIRE